MKEKILIGELGSGMSYFNKILIYESLLKNVNIVVIDPKYEYMDLKCML